jgi:hypothetical protein
LDVTWGNSAQRVPHSTLAGNPSYRLAKFTCRKPKLQDFQNSLAKTPHYSINNLPLEKENNDKQFGTQKELHLRYWNSCFI